MSTKLLSLLIPTLLLFLSALPVWGLEKSNLAVFFSNDNHGKIEPCG